MTTLRFFNEIVNFWYFLTDFDSSPTSYPSRIIFTMYESFPMRYYMTLQGYQKNNRSRLKHLNLLNKSRTFNFDLFLIPLKGLGHTVPHWKALRYGKYELSGQSCDSTLKIHQEVLKSVILLHKRGIVNSLTHTTVHEKTRAFYCSLK